MTLDDNVDANGIALARALHKTIAEHADINTGDGFADAMAAMIVAAVGVIATAPGGPSAYLQASRMIASHVAAGLLDDQTRAEAVALVTMKDMH